MQFKKSSFLIGILSAFFGVCFAQTAESQAHQIADSENLVVSAGGEVSVSQEELPAENSLEDINDPLANYNRVVFHFNDTLDRMILKPVATLYSKVIPRPLHQGITNFFSNIDNVPTIVNDLLQIKIYQAVSDSWRLFINSTVGIVGLFDVASRIGLKPHHEDFGLTLAHWGYKQSNYFEVPFFGPSTIRDAIGWPVDYFLFSVYPHISNVVVRYSVYGLGVVNRRSNFLQYQDVFEQVAVDRYIFMRNAYLQHRNYQIGENEESNGLSVSVENPSLIKNQNNNKIK